MSDRPAVSSAGLPADAQDGVQAPAFVTIDTEQPLLHRRSRVDPIRKVQQIGSLDAVVRRRLSDRCSGIFAVAALSGAFGALANAGEPSRLFPQSLA